VIKYGENESTIGITKLHAQPFKTIYLRNAKQAYYTFLKINYPQKYKEVYFFSGILS